MNVDKADVASYVFLLGVVISGVALQSHFGQFGRIPVIGLSGLLAGFWLFYLDRWSEQLSLVVTESLETEPQEART